MAAVFLGITAVIGLLITLISMVASLGHAENVMQQIYLAMFSGHAILGLLIFAIALGAAAVGDEIHKAQRAASSERRMIADAVRLLAERSIRPATVEVTAPPVLSAERSIRPATAEATAPPVLSAEPRPIGEWKAPEMAPGGWPRNPGVGR